MSVSARALAASPMPEHERPISEQFRIVSKQWVDADAAALLLKNNKETVFCEMVLAMGDMPITKAERMVRVSQGWKDHLQKIAEARREANLKRAQLEYLKIRERELDRASWNERTEHKMGRSTT